MFSVQPLGCCLGNKQAEAWTLNKDFGRQTLEQRGGQHFSEPDSTRLLQFKATRYQVCLVANATKPIA
jgi:hypothetical protein